MRRPNETLTVVDDFTRASGQLAAFNTLLCASDAVYGTEFLLDLGWKIGCYGQWIWVRRPDGPGDYKFRSIRWGGAGVHRAAGP